VRFESLYRVLFLIYCLEAGLFLTFSPWSAAWDRLAMLLPLGFLRAAFLAPWARGLFTGFGVVHLLWIVHDVDLWFRRTPDDNEIRTLRIRDR
jgi:hypothetical protein